MMIGKFAFGSMLAALVGVAACSSPGNGQPAPAGLTSPSGRTYSVTYVELHSDGTQTVKVSHWSDGDDLSVQALAQVPCHMAPLAYYDEPVGTPGDQICFGGGSGVINLSSYIDYGTTTWAGQVYSYLTPGNGSTPGYGYFAGNSAGTSYCAEYAATSTPTNVPEAASNITFINVGATSCPNPGCSAGYFECQATCMGYYEWACYPNSDCSGCTGLQISTWCKANMPCPL